MHIGNRYSVNICDDLENNVVELIDDSVGYFEESFHRDQKRSQYPV